MGENVARSLQEYLDILDNIVNSIKNRTNDSDSKKENRSILFYRGHSDVNYELVPSLFRNDEYVEKEKRICNKIIREYPSIFINNTRLANLVIMQHFGIPTRLLDFSLNPLIALYFAVTDKSDKDGKVIISVVNENRIEYENSSKMQALACLSFIDKKSIDVIKEYCFNNGEEKASNTQIKLSKIVKKNYKINIMINYLEILVKNSVSLNFKWKNLTTPFMLMANKNFDRMINQDGAFVVFGFDKNFLMSSNKFNIIDIIIPSENKQFILKQLRLIGIKDSIVYPSLESISRDMLGKKASWIEYVEI